MDGMGDPISSIVENGKWESQGKVKQCMLVAGVYREKLYIYYVYGIYYLWRLMQITCIRLYEFPSQIGIGCCLHVWNTETRQQHQVCFRVIMGAGGEGGAEEPK